MGDCVRAMAEEDRVKGMGEAAKQAEAGMALFKKDDGPLEVDLPAATAFKEAEDAKMAELDEVIKGLTGKDNKKARTDKEKEKKALKDSKQYIDAEKIVKGKEPVNGFFVVKKEEAPAPAAAAPAPKVEAQEEKKEEKDKKEKPKKAMDSAGISKAERDELEKLKNDIISRKKELKDQGMSGGQMNKDEQIVTWVSRMNELKEKECPGSTAPGKKDDKDKKKEGKANKTEEKIALEAKIEEYRLQLMQEFKYSPKEIKADPDMAEMVKALAKMK